MDESALQVLLVDDDRQFCDRFGPLVENEIGVSVTAVYDLDAARKALRSHEVHVVLLDLLFDGQPKAFDLLKEIVAEDLHPTVLVLTSSSDTAFAVKAIKLGALDYVEKSAPLERRFQSIRVAIEASKLVLENRNLRKKIQQDHHIEGEHESIRELHRTIAKYAMVDEHVLISGESGTGKDLVAHGLHAHSDRVSQPFVAKNCAMIPRDLFESELFGHLRGAFSGATEDRPGVFLEAGRGVIFLDEIHQLPLELQPKLLRVVEQGTVQQLGSAREIPCPARFVVASSQNLRTLVNEGKFRAELYYRLNVLRINLLPLRQRLSDIPILYEYFMKKHFTELGKAVPKTDRVVMDALIAFQWPGNIRELDYVVTRLSVNHEGERVTAVDAAEALPELEIPGVPVSRLRLARETAERNMLLSALEQHSWNVQRAAEYLNESRWNLYDKIKKYNLRRRSD